jgi:hypothetical protein
LEYLVRHKSQIRAFALPIRYPAASSDLLQKEQFVETELPIQGSEAERIRGTLRNRLTFDFGGCLFIRCGWPLLPQTPSRPGVQHDMNATAPERSPHIQTDDDQFNSLSNRTGCTRAISDYPVISLAYFIAVPISARRSGRRRDRPDRHDLERVR